MAIIRYRTTRYTLCFHKALAMQTFSAAIFDMDGLLIDSERVIMNTWLTVGKRLGVNIPQAEYLRIIGKETRACHEILVELLGGEDVFREALIMVRQQLAIPGEQPLFPVKSGAEALLNTLIRLGVPCAVASSSPAAEIRSRLERVSLLRFFEAIAGGDEVPYGKPNPAVYLLAAERLQKSASECLAFEDSENGIRAATSAGAMVVTVPDLKTPTAEMIQLSFKVLENLDQAIAHAGEWFPILR